MNVGIGKPEVIGQDLPIHPTPTPGERELKWLLISVVKIR